MLHNDLKTANVLVGSTFQAKLTDFGLSMKRKTNGYLGTPFWMAPELFVQVRRCSPCTRRTNIVMRAGSGFYALMF